MVSDNTIVLAGLKRQNEQIQADLKLVAMGSLVAAR
jgi:hypothetical protein